MKANAERVGKGFFIKTSKTWNSWLVDPFQLNRVGESLVAHRTNYRLMILKERDYILDDLVVSELRLFNKEEFSAIVSSPIGDELDEDFAIADAKCFDIEFRKGGERKQMTVFAKYLDCVRNLHRVMKAKKEEMEEVKATVSIDDLLTPAGHVKRGKGFCVSSGVQSTVTSSGIDEFLLNGSNLDRTAYKDWGKSTVDKKGLG